MLGNLPTIKTLSDRTLAELAAMIRWWRRQPDTRRIAGMTGVRESGGGGDRPFYTVKQNDGTAGGDGLFCSFTYDVFKYGDNPDADPPVATGVALTGNGNRVEAMTMVAGTVGMGFKGPDGFVLIWVDEQAAGYLDCGV